MAALHKSKRINMKGNAIICDQILTPSGNVAMDFTSSDVASDGLGGGIGTTSDPFVVGASGGKVLDYVATSAGGNGTDTRTIYARLYWTAGGGGEAVRAYGTVNNATAAVGGTVNGAHISLKISGASGAISGSGNALRCTFEVDNAAASVGGTTSVARFDTSMVASSTPSTGFAFLAFNDLDSVKTPYLMSVESGASSVVTTAGTGAGSAGAAGGAVATHVFKVRVSGTDYFIPLCNTNA